MLSIIILSLPIYFWEKHSVKFLFLSILFLVFVLIFGKVINGASRWIKFGFFYFQPSEFSKLFLFCYISSYLNRKIKKINFKLWDFFKPIFIMFILSILLIIQPDFGTVFIIFFTTLIILFIAGSKFLHLLLITFIGLFFIILLILISPYRINRIIVFWQPWLDPFGKGYQLTYSFMAIGRGYFLGQGLGNSLIKLNYLPEAHTDFIFSIFSEEMGYLITITTISMIFFYV